MEIKSGRFGEYLACVDYPKCKTTETILNFIGVKCPVCGGELVERHTKKGGKPFYGCNKFPKCQFAIWDKPKDTEDAAAIKAKGDARTEKWKGKGEAKAVKGGAKKVGKKK
jgi:ssDNA-binding Zn-finger/Zn-ribbon topoisomerase 1